jgi:hypothetical protein
MPMQNINSMFLVEMATSGSAPLAAPAHMGGRRRNRNRTRRQQKQKQQQRKSRRQRQSRRH